MGEFKSTPHDVNLIEDIFPHAWSILRGAGLTEPLRIRSVDMVDGRGARSTWPLARRAWS